MLILFCLALVAGASSSFVLGYTLFGISIIAGAILCIVTLFLRSKKGFILGLALALTFFLGAYRIYTNQNQSIFLGAYEGNAKVQSVDRRLEKTIFVVTLLGGNDNRVRVTTSKRESFLPGDTVYVRGDIEYPQDFMTDTGRIFDYDGYLKSRGMYSVVYNPDIFLVKRGNEWHPSRIATKLRYGIVSLFTRAIRFPYDGIVGGMLVGYQGGIPDSISDIFRKTGTLHTLVLSGYNITVLAGFLGLLLRRAPFMVRTLFIFLGIALLVGISGAGVAALRAGIMGSIALFAGVTQHQYNAFRALFISLIFFFFIRPETIFADPGFHLSFLATFFIITILPILKEKMVWIPDWKKYALRETFILAFGLPLFMLPYFMYFSGLFSFMSPFANIVMVPFIPTLMLGGLFVIIFSFIPPFALFFSSITSFVGSGMVSILSFFSSVPEWNTPALSGWGVVFVYLIVILFIFWKTIREYFLQLQNIFQRQTSSY